jgi:tetratricopeptide (TPR) repeat protein
LAEGDADEMYTDSNGGFAFRSLPSGVYYVVVEAEGYRPVRQAVHVDERVTPVVQVNIALEATNKGSGPAGQIVSGSGSSYELKAKKGPNSFDAKALREFDKGNRKQKEGNFQAAVAHYRKALRIEPDLYPALNDLGTIFERQKDHAQAEAAFVKSLTINPDDGEAYINLGHVLYEEGKYQPAIERLEQGLRHAPRSALGHFFLGSSYLRLGDLDKAEPNLKSASALDPASMARAHLQLANLYLRRGDTNAASAELENYLRANPSDPQAPAIRKRLANLHSPRTN